MGDHFVLLVDRLLTESTLEATLESRNRINQTITPTVIDENCSDLISKDCGADLSLRKRVECRICQDEDWDSNMETPCSCCGSLKYAHRRCVQRWCNEKGDTVCEICHQHFWPGYTAPPSIFRLRSIPMNFRRDVSNARLITMVSTDESLLDQDEYAATSSRSIMCCQLIALIVKSLSNLVSFVSLNPGKFSQHRIDHVKVDSSAKIGSQAGTLRADLTIYQQEVDSWLIMILLVLQHALPIIVNHVGHYSFPLITLLLLRVAGIILPVYIIMKVVTGILRLRQNRNVNVSLPSPHEEASSAASP